MKEARNEEYPQIPDPQALIALVRGEGKDVHK
jgi:hypothetical protein